jgi:hypothetical protein
MTKDVNVTTINCPDLHCYSLTLRHWKATLVKGYCDAEKNQMSPVISKEHAKVVSDRLNPRSLAEYNGHTIPAPRG